MINFLRRLLGVYLIPDIGASPEELLRRSNAPYAFYLRNDR